MGRGSRKRGKLEDDENRFDEDEDEDEDEDDSQDMLKMYQEMKLKMAAMESIMLRRLNDKGRKRRKRRRTRKSNDVDDSGDEKRTSKKKGSSTSTMDEKLTVKEKGDMKSDEPSSMEVDTESTPAPPREPAPAPAPAPPPSPTKDTTTQPETAEDSRDAVKTENEEVTAVTVKAEEPPKPKELSEEEKMWKEVQENPEHFDTWVSLASRLEQKDDYKALSECLRALLKEYPFCYGYWTKLAELEKRYGHANLQLQVCEEGVAAAEHCHEMWTYYCSIDMDSENDDLIAETRRRFERAAKVIGSDFQSHQFWNKYIEFETSHDENQRAAGIYLRILRTPLAMLDEYYKKYEEFASKRPVKDLLSELAGRDFNPSSVEESEKYRNEIMAEHKEVYLKTKLEKETLDYFENRIARAYFHVKDLNESDISNWHSYLDFCEARVREDAKQFRPMTVKIYERCLIACANYPEFWIRFATFVEGQGLETGVADARSIYNRATSIFTKRQPECFLEYALFEERHGNIEQARGIYQHILENVSPGLVQGLVNLTNFERRRGNVEEACKIYDAALEGANFEEIPLLAVNAGKFYAKIKKDANRAREIYEEALRHRTDCADLWLAYVTFEDSVSSSYTDKIKPIFERALAEDSKLQAQDREVLASFYLEYASDYAPSLEDVQSIQKRFPTITPLLSFEKKRPLASYVHSPTSSTASTIASSHQQQIKQEVGAVSSTEGLASGADQSQVSTEAAIASTAQDVTAYSTGAAASAAAGATAQQSAAAASYSSHADYYQQYGYAYPGYGYDASAWAAQQAQYAAATQAQQ
mmetsp:Transcript_23036/g.37004  ORF Transcript_23036/g.37004 Transcript_23036/m.37004 type:complete len:815 (+) Transcript_23036:53-2497(+)